MGLIMKKVVSIYVNIETWENARKIHYIKGFKSMGLLIDDLIEKWLNEVKGIEK